LDTKIEHRKSKIGRNEKHGLCSVARDAAKKLARAARIGFGDGVRAERGVVGGAGL